MANRNDDEEAPLLHETSKAADHDESSTSSHYGTNGSAQASEQNKTSESAAAKATDEDEPQFEGLPEVRKQLKWIMPSVAVGIFLTAADQTIVVASYGKIGSDLNSLNNTSWIASAFFLTLTSIQPLYGKLSDLFGRKPCLLFAYSVFGLGCLFCGLARNMTELILARAFSGIGGGGMTTVVSIMLSDIVPLRERGTWQGILNIVFAAGSGCGAPLGGLIADLIGWRWSFFFQVPLCAVAIIAVFFAIHLPPHDTSNWRKKFRRIDFLGAFLLVSAVFCLIFGMDRGANEKWKSIAALLPLCLSIPLFAIFVYVEAKVAKEPFAPAHLIFRRKVLPAYLCNFCSFGGYMGVIFFLPLYFQAVDQFSASQAGVHLLPGVIASVTGSLTGGLIMQRTGRYYWLNLLAYSVLFVAFIPMLLFSGTISNSLVGILIAFFFVGIGAGMGVTTSLIAIISNVQMKDQAVATANSYLFRSLGSVVGISLVSTVVQQSLKMQLKNRLKSGRDIDEIVAKVKHSLAYIETLQPAMQQVVRDCYGTAIRNGHVIGITLGFCAFVASIFVKEAKLSK